MNGNRQHIAPVIENALCPVSVMNIHIQDCRLFPGLEKMLRGDGGVVQEAEPARIIAEGVMAGRAAERIG